MIRSKAMGPELETKSLVRDSSESRLHKKAIERIAAVYNRSGYTVKADHIDEFEYPEKCRMMKPDIVAENGEEKVIIEVETKNSVDTRREKLQRREFGKWAKESENRDFRREVVL